MYVSLGRREKTEFYQSLKAFLPEKPLIYYPGSGSDPIPFEAFGQNIIYGSLMESDYFRFLTDPSAPKPAAYKERILKNGPYKNLKAVYTDVLKSPFSSSVFDSIIIQGIPINILKDQKITQEASRLLKPEGILVIEDSFLLNEKGEAGNDFKKLFKNLTDCGFEDHILDHYGGIYNLHFLRTFPWLDEIRGAIIEKNEFTEGVKNGEPVKMCGTEIRVFKKEK